MSQGPSYLRFTCPAAVIHGGPAKVLAYGPVELRGATDATCAGLGGSERRSMNDQLHPLLALSAAAFSGRRLYDATLPRDQAEALLGQLHAEGQAALGRVLPEGVYVLSSVPFPGWDRWTDQIQALDAFHDHFLAAAEGDILTGGE
ncbi:MAG TPA: hypothetical protein VKA46_18940 [Gemmataceae bacterium]|nr:hypothetical protein [Gemmataceae bacterium]